MKITLINPPWYVSERQFLEKRNLSQCLGLGYIASYLRLHGHSVDFIDALAEGSDTIKKVYHRDQPLLCRGISYENITDRIARDTDLIGISIPFTNISTIAKQLCLFIKNKYPSKPIVVGGVHPSAFPVDMLDSGVDYVVRGEGELSMLALACGKDPTKIRGLIHKGNIGSSNNDISEQVENLDAIPFPYRPPELMEQYLSYSPRGEQGKRSLSVITSRGCPYDCLFCSVHPVYGYKWRARTPKNVLEEIAYYVSNYGVNNIEFEDDNLTLDAYRAEEIFDRIINLDKKITWAVNNGLRVDTLSERLIEKMKKSGCIQLNLAVESGNQKVLESMHKKLSLAKVEEVVEMCSKIKIPTLAFFLVGFPGETKESFSETVRFIRKLKKKGLNKIGVMIINAYPGTGLYKYCQNKGYLVKDIDEHIFVDSDYVSVITEDFDERLVINWRDELYGIFHPFRWHMKELVKRLLPNLFFKRFISLYRKIRNIGLKLNPKLLFTRGTVKYEDNAGIPKI